jgi:TDG/mug DNA glycosylase family protein
MAVTGRERKGLPPVVDAGATILILGAFPGEESLRRQQYYAHPRNLFWDMMGAVCGAGRDNTYAERVAVVRGHGIALWDVVGSCSRVGSMDADIRPGGFTVNDFRSFLARYPINCIFFDGAKAAELFRRHVLPTLTEPPELIVLPSTSPANARISKQEKVGRWLEIGKHLPRRSENCCPHLPEKD